MSNIGSRSTTPMAPTISASAKLGLSTPFFNFRLFSQIITSFSWMGFYAGIESTSSNLLKGVPISSSNLIHSLLFFAVVTIVT